LCPAGGLHEVARAAKEMLDRRRDASILVLDGVTSGPIEIDFRAPSRMSGAAAEDPRCCFLRQPCGIGSSAEPRAGPNRNGVVARRNHFAAAHWDWLAQQRGAPRLRSADWSRRRGGPAKTGIASPGQEAAYSFMSAMAGNRPHYEDRSGAVRR